jgi:VWFA-related protein
MRDSFLALVLVFALLAPTAAQQPATPAQKPEQVKDEVVRITTNLVQIDAVITNRRGEQITDLAPEDFEIFEDGHLQEIKNFSYVTVEKEPVTAPVKPKSKDKTFVPPPPPPPEQLRPEQVRRSIALVVDDLGLSFETTSFVRKALRKFVDEQMRSGDMVAIIRTGAGVGALQQFTTDKQVLHAAIDRVKWNAFGRRGMNAFGNAGEDAFHTEPSDPRRGRYTSIDPDAEMKGSTMNSEQREAANRARGNDFRDEIFTVGTLGALNYVVKGLRELPGRKSVVLLTDELDLFSSTSSSNFRILDALRHLIDLANRSSVVFYTIDPRGIPVLNDSAANSMVGASKGDGQGGVGSSGPTGSKLMQDLMSRSLEIAEAENGMNYLAKQTGGFLVNNNNDVAGGIRRVLDQKGYYLIGYRPQESTFNAAGKRSYHKLELRVKRPGLTVHTRAGFYGVSSEAAVPVNRTRLQQLVSALTSPFASGAVDLRLTSVFLNDPTNGSFVRSLIHVDGSSLTFTNEADGAHKATVDVAAVTFDDGGAVVDQRFRTETMLVRGDEYRNAQRDGITFGINLPIKKPGAFQLRIAVLDVPSSRAGSANQFIEIPNLNKNKLTLSGLYLAGNISRRQNNVTIQPASGVSSTPAAAAVDLGEAAAQAGPAVRSFRPGMMLDYGYEAYNVRLDSSGRAKLQIQLRLFKENQQLFSGAPMDLAGTPNAKRVSAIGHLQLGQNLGAGDYVLQIIVSDIAEPNKRRVASQWIPFEVE